MPETFEALAILLVLSVPAYITIAVYKSRNPVQYSRRKQSAIEQTTLYVFLGTVVNLVTLLFLGLLTVVVTSFLPPAAPTIPSIAGNKAEEMLVVIFLLLLVYLVPSVVFSFIIGSVISQLLPEEPPLWWKELGALGARQATTGIPPWVLANLKNGDRCLGLVGEVRWIGDENNTMELTLEKTIYEIAGTKDRMKIGRILLRSEDILWLSPHLG